jgi:hypothetical protein
MTHPAYNFATVAPNDSTDLPGGQARAFYVGTGGTLALQNNAGVTVSFPSVNGGSILPVSSRRVLATGTTASNIIALF